MTITYNKYPVHIDKWGIEFLSKSGWLLWVWPWMRHTNNECSIYSLDFLCPFKNIEDFYKYDRECKEELKRLANQERF